MRSSHFFYTLHVQYWSLYSAGMRQPVMLALWWQAAPLRTLPLLTVPIRVKRCRRHYVGQPALRNRRYRGAYTALCNRRSWWRSYAC